MRHELIRRNLDLLAEGRTVLLDLSTEDYARGGTPKEAASVGQHVRHCIELYECFLSGLPSEAVDYDARPRDDRLERDPGTARSRLDDVVRRLEALAGEVPGVRLRVRMDEAGPGGAWAPSTVERELQFLASHTVHHWALCALLLALEDCPVPEGFGVGQATRRHRSRTVGAR